MKPYRISLTLILLIGILVTGCFKDEAEPERPIFKLEKADDIPEEEYAVCSVVLENHYRTSRIVIDQQSSKSKHITENLEQLTRDNEDIETALIQDYLYSNEEIFLFGNNFSSSSQINIISPEEQEFMFESQNVMANWDGFFEEYPNSRGMVRFSRVGFNGNSDQALVQVSTTCGNPCGSGTLYYLNKQNGEWIINDIVLMWSI